MTLESVGFIRTSAIDVPRHYSISEVEGEIVVFPRFAAGLEGFVPGDPEWIMVLFLFDRSPAFHRDKLRQIPPHRDTSRGVFLTCSPIRPNPFGVSILKVLEVKDTVIRVRGLDILDGTPVLDIKPWKKEFAR
jgi:tRNA-Thr(GGU) m(6)t(6)A37 methyltransferase TsaA